MSERNASRAPSTKERSMIAVIFEVWPHPDRKHEYLDIAAELRPTLEKIDGFISVERFASLTDSGKLLSLSFFRDDTAVMAWRKTNPHRRAQAAGRGGIFDNYRLRVADVLRDYGMTDRLQAPDDSRSVHDRTEALDCSFAPNETDSTSDSGDGQ